MIRDKFSKFVCHLLAGVLLIVLVFWVWGSPVSASNSSLDVDDNGQADVLTDGMIILRYLFGFQSAALINGILALDAQRTEPVQILACLDPLRLTMLDVDCNGKADAFTDGMLIARFLMGFSGSALINGVLDPAGCRTTGEDISAYLTSYLPGNNVVPEANAGHDQTVAVGTTVSLDGHQSFDLDGDPLTYSWVFDVIPADSEAALNTADSMLSSFSVDVEGEYRLQ